MVAAVLFLPRNYSLVLCPRSFLHTLFACSYPALSATELLGILFSLASVSILWPEPAEVGDGVDSFDLVSLFRRRDKSFSTRTDVSKGFVEGIGVELVELGICAVVVNVAVVVAERAELGGTGRDGR